MTPIDPLVGADTPDRVEPPRSPGRRRPRWPLLVVLVGALGVLLGAVIARDDPGSPSAATTASTIGVTVPGQVPPAFKRDAHVYDGLGTWVDVFDYVQLYQAAGQQPVVTPASVDVMAAQGVRTLYLQATRNDDKLGPGLVDASLLTAFIEKAHAHGMRVVGWYAPTFADVEGDLARLEAIHAFRTTSGEQFDGLAVDIEVTDAVTDVTDRSNRVVELSKRLRQSMGNDAVGAIVLPPVLTEVVNPNFWPQFPWRQIAGDYDVWLPMVYWSGRREDSGYKNGFTYTDESVRRLRANLGWADAPVHPIAGIASEISEQEAQQYLQALRADKAVGGSVYDYRTTPGGVWGVLRAGLATG